MARVTFTERFDYRPRANVVIAYKGGTHTVKRECADQAIALGKAVEIHAPARPDAPAIVKPRRARVWRG